MGQYWYIFNLDKLEYAYCGGYKFGELFYNIEEKIMLNLLLSGQPGHQLWGGDRIILLGDYSRELPPNIVTDDDSDILKRCAGIIPAKEGNTIRSYDILTRHSRELETVNRPSTRLPSDTVYVLRSHTKKEYVRRDVIRNYRDYPERRLPGLAQALFTLVGWSWDPSVSCRYNNDDFVPASGGKTVPLHSGAWAGDRIDIVVLTDEIQKIFDDEGWSDISEEKARHVSDVYASDDF